MNQQLLASKFENIVSEIFSSLNFEISRNVKVNSSNPHSEIDLVLNTGAQEVWAEVKFYRDARVSSYRLEQAVSILFTNISSALTRISGLLVVSSYVSSVYKLHIKQKLGITIWDRSDLFYFIKDVLKDDEIFETLEHLLLLAKQGLDTQDVFEKVEAPKDKRDYLIDLKSPTIETEEDLTVPADRGDKLCSELNAIPIGRAGWVEYEKKCIEILKYVFEKELNNWNAQNTTDDELSRFDMICGIIQQTGFWGTLIQSFHSRFVLFEFKNYTEPIGQDQVYTTERYLYLKGLRSVGFIISRNGGKPQATKACKGALREHGKLILILDNIDLCTMLKMKDNGDDPGDHLSGKLDEFLISLSR